MPKLPKSQPSHPYAFRIGTDDDPVEVHVTREGRVFWCEDWSRVDSLARAGFLSSVSGGAGTHGHTDYYFTG